MRAVESARRNVKMYGRTLSARKGFDVDKKVGGGGGGDGGGDGGGASDRVE